MAVQVLRRRFTVDEYHLMGQVGILGEDDRVELLEGEIVEMAPIGSRYQATVDRLTELFSRRVGDSASIRVQGPVRLAGDSEPEPDLTLLRRRTDFYATAHPGPEDVLLLVEVSDSSIDYDRDVKLPHYARQGVPEVWIVDLEREAIEVYTYPATEGYSGFSQPVRGQNLVPQHFPSLDLAVDEVLG
ncbi:MAG: hypothetical protein BZY81_01605 [SAR202 cluster bacterium Io17-Chloro-G4]|nr:MAG: hypothetical protein BZY81_01605 [SAR202 cluster bacterium Io17-Chloro-G4]